MKFCYLFLVLAVAAANCQVQDINKEVDLTLAKTNERLRARRFTSIHLPFPKDDPVPSMLFEDSILLGLDSLTRTGNCTLELKDKNGHFDFHLGLGLLQQSFEYLNIYGREMSGSFRVWDNSVHLAYTIANADKTDDGCFAILHDLSFEKLANVEFSSSRSEFDRTPVEQYFGKVLMPYLNEKIHKSTIEKFLEAFHCKSSHLDISELTQFISKLL